MKHIALELRAYGERDARQGKPIDAFQNLPYARKTEAMRADYEIGYRAVKAEMREARNQSNTETGQ